MYTTMLNEDDDPITTPENNFEEVVKADIERNASITSKISTLEDDLVNIQQELPMQLSEFSSIDGDVDLESGEILTLLEKRNTITKRISSLVRRILWAPIKNAALRN